MNLESARNRIKIIEGLAKRIGRYSEAVGMYGNDADTILKQCRFLELDLRESEDIGAEGK